MADWNCPWPLAILLGLAVGAVDRCLAGLLGRATSGFRRSSSTLAGMLIFRGGNQFIGKSTTDAGAAGVRHHRRRVPARARPVPLNINVRRCCSALLGARLDRLDEIRLRRSPARRWASDAAPLWVSIVKVVLLAGVILWAALAVRHRASGTSFPISGIILVVLVIALLVHHQQHHLRPAHLRGRRQLSRRRAVGRQGPPGQLLRHDEHVGARCPRRNDLRRPLRASGPQDGIGWELDAIAAVFIGGAAVSGGIGTVIGSIVGGLVMAVPQQRSAAASVSVPTSCR